jgi:hypothetical protein
MESPKPTSAAPVVSPVQPKRPRAPAAHARPGRRPKAEPEKLAKEEKPKKKKRRAKPVFEADKAPRRRKGERKIIEERIELEESELEALNAVKSEGIADDVGVEFGAQPEDAVGEYEAKDAEKPMKGVFGDMLKSALSEKQQDQTVIKGTEGKKAKTKAKKIKK